MKRQNIIGALSFILVLFLLISCTKDELLPAPENSYAKSIPLPESYSPVYNFGAIKGMLSPAPAVANIKVYNDNGYSVGLKPGPDGSFLAGNLPEGNYSMTIAYLVQRAEYSYTAYYEIAGIEVKVNETMSLGVINLPWTY